MPLSTYLPEKMGSATIEPSGVFEAGSFASFVLTYTAGHFGIDDTGSLKVVHRFASDMGRPQFDDPEAANYVTAEASNGAVLDLRYDVKNNIRPWDKTLYIKLVRGFLREGDRITVRFGDPREGSPGMRLQTFSEETFEFRVLVDALATCDYVELPEQPVISIVPGPPAGWRLVLPTVVRCDEPFRLCLKAEDKWGNPTDRAELAFALKASLAVEGLPESGSIGGGELAVVFDRLRARRAGDLTIEMADQTGAVLAVSNPLRVVPEAALMPFWGDLHGQSEETVGTNSARDYFAFARDRAFLDACAHQGNDFQITKEFWAHLNALTAEFNEDGRFVTFPGYEWSGNTGLGGDRNVLFADEGRQIHRSSHALVDDLSDIDTDATTARGLFEALKDEDCVVFAHVGGRYADIKMAHDARLECSVEVHSAWGTFEWLLDDAFERGYRVGIVCNSDGHKGRPGASYPGATLFGAYGGLTCFLATGLTRAGLMESLRRRHHYGTTGCRMLLDTRVDFETEAELLSDYPYSGAAGSSRVRTAMMGDIISYSGEEVILRIDALASAPIERIEIRNGRQTLETVRPFENSDLGRRVRVVWEGSEYRGRGRQTIWDGEASLAGNRFRRLRPLNFHNPEKKLVQTGPDRVEWTSLTTGGFAGFDAWLDDAREGTLSIRTGLVTCDVALADVGMEDLVFDAGGLERRIRIFRLPDENPHLTAVLERRVELRAAGDNPLYVRLTQEDGHLAWSSPVYVFRRAGGGEERKKGDKSLPGH